MVKEQSRRFKDRGHSVTVLTSRVPNTQGEESISGVTIKRPWRPAISRTTGIVFHLTTFLSFICFAIVERKHQYDVVHGHMTHYPLVTALILGLGLRRTKIVATSHGSDLNVLGRNSAYRWLLIQLMHHVNWLVVVSSDLIQVAESLGIDGHKIKYIPNGVSREFLEIKTTEVPEYDVLFFGGLKWQKGLRYLLKAVSLLSERGHPLRVAIAGRGPNLRRLLRMKEELKLSSVSFMGEIDSDGIKGLLSKSALVVFPSVTEGLPCALLEAMAAAKPIVATQVGGMRILNHDVDSVIVRPRNSNALANAILSLIDDQQKQQRISRNARAVTVRHFMWEQAVEMQLRLYRQ